MSYPSQSSSAGPSQPLRSILRAPTASFPNLTAPAPPSGRALNHQASRSYPSAMHQDYTPYSQPSQQTSSPAESSKRKDRDYDDQPASPNKRQMTPGHPDPSQSVLAQERAALRPRLSIQIPRSPFSSSVPEISIPSHLREQPNQPTFTPPASNYQQYHPYPAPAPYYNQYPPPISQLSYPYEAEEYNYTSPEPWNDSESETLYERSATESEATLAESYEPAGQNDVLMGEAADEVYDAGDEREGMIVVAEGFSVLPNVGFQPPAAPAATAEPAPFAPRPFPGCRGGVIVVIIKRQHRRKDNNRCLKLDKGGPHDINDWEGHRGSGVMKASFCKSSTRKCVISLGCGRHFDFQSSTMLDNRVEIWI